ncbi:MAG: YkvA family protein [Xanthobacteraceae bacterium]
MSAATSENQFARSAADDAVRVARGFWHKLRTVAAYVPFAEDAIAAYYCALDRATPVRVRAAIFGALVYFIAPADALPDVLPALGFTDDAAVLAATLQLIAAYILPEHREAARRALTDVGEAPQR